MNPEKLTSFPHLLSRNLLKLSSLLDKDWPADQEFFFFFFFASQVRRIRKIRIPLPAPFEQSPFIHSSTYCYIQPL